MAWPSIMLVVYGVMNVALGVYGYTSKGSLISMLAGGAAGLIVIYAAILAKTHPNYGYGLGALIALLLLGRFVPGWLKPDHDWFPPTMVITSALVVLALIAAHFMAAKPAGQ